MILLNASFTSPLGTATLSVPLLIAVVGLLLMWLSRDARGRGDELSTKDGSRRSTARDDSAGVFGAQ